jgi:hypothetical protein
VNRFLVDEDFNNDLVRGLLRRCPGTDLVRVQDIGLVARPTTPCWPERHPRDGSS